MTPPHPQEQQAHWLSKYATNHHTWTLSTSSTSSKKTFKRPLGLIETSFDTDGRYFGGRADMTALFTLAVRHKLSTPDLRRRIALAWTSLRLQHVLLMSRAADDENGERCFFVDVPRSTQEALRDVEDGIVWMDDLYEHGDVDEQELYQHAFNVGRIVDPETCMSKVFVLPLTARPDGTVEIRFLIIMGHQISDGLSAYNWFSHFIRILNTSSSEIEASITSAIHEDQIRTCLPPAQEDLYPVIAGSKARQRWFWALIRVLRHVNRTFPPTFVNPLRREHRLEKPVAFEPKYARIFDYSEARRPPMNGGNIGAALSASASQRLMSLCREAKVSIGAGCFALAGMSMMEIHEERYPDIPAAERPAFAASFPLNPRAFFANPPAADSCMLAFSEGIVMPSLPSTLPVEGRFRLIAKHANRELKIYQKRLKAKTGAEGADVSLDKHSPGRLLASGYVATLERVDAKLPPERQTHVTPQGSLEASMGQYGATCGVSSVGSIAPFFKAGRNDLNDMSGKDMVADYRNLRIGVRAREYEFLIGSSTNAEGRVGFGVSYDMNAISIEAAENWKQKIENLLEKGSGSRL